ncbi:MAG: glycosyltransferase family 4 protein [Frankiaceae bacterium]
MREYALTLIIAATVTLLLTPLVRRLAIAAGAMARVRDRDVHTIPTPRWGGVAMLGGFAAGLHVANHLPALRTVIRTSNQAQAVLLAGALICLLGVLDDRWELDALTKLAGQILAAGVAVLNGVQLLWIPLPSAGGHPSAVALGPEYGVPLTVLFIVLTINAVNFIDGLDGLAAGVVAIAALAFFAYSYQLSAQRGLQVLSAPTLITALLAGCCLGFLPHNFNPARIFMGDSGSMLVGLLLGTSTITLTGSVDPLSIRNLDLVPALLPLILPFAVLAVPFVDLTLAVARRMRAGRSPFSPDTLHLHHRLLRIGHSHTRAVLIMYFWAALLGSAVVAASITGGPLEVGAIAAAVAVVAVVASAVPRLRAARRPGSH